MSIDIENFLASLENIALGYGGIFVVTAIIVGVVYLLNNVPEKIAEIKRKREEDEDDE